MPAVGVGVGGRDSHDSYAAAATASSVASADYFQPTDLSLMQQVLFSYVHNYKTLYRNL